MGSLTSETLRAEPAVHLERRGNLTFLEQMPWLGHEASTSPMSLLYLHCNLQGARVLVYRQGKWVTERLSHCPMRAWQNRGLSVARVSATSEAKEGGGAVRKVTG